MLKVDKNITLNGSSLVNGVQVAWMSATISSDGGVGANKTITNQELYNSNKVEVRADITSFEEQVYKLEDELLKSESTEEVTKIRKAGK